MNKKMYILLIVEFFSFCCQGVRGANSDQDFSKQKLVIIPQYKDYNSVIKWDAKEPLSDVFQGKNTSHDCFHDAESKLVETVKTRNYLPLSDKVFLNNVDDSFAAVDYGKRFKNRLAK